MHYRRFFFVKTFFFGFVFCGRVKKYTVICNSIAKCSGDVCLSVRFFCPNIFGGMLYVYFLARLPVSYVYLHYNFIFVCSVFLHRVLVIRQHRLHFFVTQNQLKLQCFVQLHESSPLNEIYYVQSIRNKLYILMPSALILLRLEYLLKSFIFLTSANFCVVVAFWYFF
jgi:hypothetical protein